MGFLNFALLAAIGCWVAGGIALGLTLPWDHAMIAWCLLGLSGLVGLYGLVNAATLRVTHYTVRLPHLAASWEGRQVALVTDIHVGTIRGPRFVGKIVARLRALEPSAVFISGDMFDGPKVDIARAVKPWHALRVPAGIFFVTGNHDEFSDRGPYLTELTKVGVRPLHDEKVTIDGLQIIGIHDAETHDAEVYRDVLARAGIDRHQPSILLVHRPSHLAIPAEAGISLQLSGHTHAGQFFPWSLLVRMIYKQFAYGLNRFGPLQVVTSSGAGSAGPPMRLDTRSEIVLLRLERANPTEDARAAWPFSATADPLLRRGQEHRSSCAST